MTGNEVYREALGHLMEPAGQDSAFLNSALMLINAGITELHPVQESICKRENRAFTPSKIVSLDDEIPLDLALCNILPLYLASEFFRDDLEPDAAKTFYSRFENGKNALMAAHFADIEDVYGGDSDV